MERQLAEQQQQLAMQQEQARQDAMAKEQALLNARYKSGIMVNENGGKGGGVSPNGDASAMAGIPPELAPLFMGMQASQQSNANGNQAGASKSTHCK
jgi:type IV secretion system protein VirB10